MSGADKTLEQGDEDEEDEAAIVHAQGDHA